MKSCEIRTKFLEFFEKQDHKILASSSLIPQNDPSLLFVNAGMNQFKNVFLGLEAPKHPQVTTIQKCLRAGGKHNDIETVGQTPWHHTFFEMMGNFSFGSYFKKEAIKMAWDFLVQEMGFSEDHLWVSVFKDDKESYEIWRDQQKIPEHKIFKLGAKDNFWQMGDVGPCGPCSEIHYYAGNKKNPDPEKDLVEVWNLVFMEFYDNEQGKREKLPKPCVDTGMGLERLVSLVQNTKSNYHADLFKSIIASIENKSSKKYDFSESKQDELQMAFRVVADHGRAVAFLINDGILPGSENQSYVLRRIMRRAFYYGQKLKPDTNLLATSAEAVADLMLKSHPSLQKEKDYILSTINDEYERFSQNLNIVQKRFSKTAVSDSGSKISQVDFKTAWDLYSTYGCPFDLTRLMAQKNGIKMISEEDFEKQKKNLLENQDTTSKTKGSSFESFIKTLSSKHWDLKTKFTGYETHKENSKILFLFDEQKEQKSVKEAQVAWLIAETTCFYPEGGGPIGDRGFIQTPSGKAEVLDCQKRNGVIFHKIKIMKGNLSQSQDCELVVDQNFRSLIATGHTATHLLNASLRKILGSGIRQAGSLVETGYLRFDFSHPKALTKKELSLIEKDVNDKISSKENLTSKTLPFQKAIDEGALYLKGDSYTEDVRVITVGKDSSKELCGGIHVKNTKDIKVFRIISETGVQSGVRRISAYTSDMAVSWEKALEKQTLDLAGHLNLNEKDCNKKDNPFLKWDLEMDEKIKTLKNKIVNLKTSASKKISGKQSLDSSYDLFDRAYLVKHNLGLREHLGFPIQKEIEKENPLIAWAQKRWSQLERLKSQDKNMESFVKEQEDLIKKSKVFESDNKKSQLIVANLPLEDRKLIAETADQIKSKVLSAVIVVIGQGQGASPIVVSVTKDLKDKISAGDLLKNHISKWLGGKGGGQSHFAQGTITDTSKISELEENLFQHLSKN